MVNSCKCYSSSFSEVLIIRVVSAALLQILAVHGREASGEQGVRDFQSTQTEQRLRLMFVEFSVLCSPVFHSLTTA